MANDEQSVTQAKLRYWCDFDTSRNKNHDSLFNLKQKLLKCENASSKQLEDLVQKEILQQPTKVEPRLLMIKLFLDQNRVSDAFQYAYDLEMQQLECFARSLDWYTCLGQVVEKVNDNLITSSWQYWILRLSSIERQLELTLTVELNVYSQTATLTDCTKLLFQLDQMLDVAAKSVNETYTEIQLVTQYLKHYRGQFCLHAAALIIKRGTVQKIHWREIIKYSLPLLLLAYNFRIPTTDWSRNSTEITKKLLRLCGQEAAFRCVQSGRTLLSCVDDYRACSVMDNIRTICSEKGTFTSNDELLAQIRQFCSDSNWRKQIFRILFTSNDQIAKLHSSHFIQNIVFAEPIYEIPNASDLDTYEKMAQLLYPSSLSHLVYLSLNTKRLADFRCNVFNGLNLSVTNLANCGAETLNQLDIDSFLYASTEQTRVNLNIERNVYESVNATSSIMTKPKMLPFANIMNNLSTEEQVWWSAAYRAYKNMSGTDLDEIRPILQYGIEAVRGVGGPKMNVMIYLRLGEIFMVRTRECSKTTERIFLEERTVALFRFALCMIKMQNNSYPEQFHNSFEQEKEMNTVTEEAVTYLAAHYFRNEEYEECIDELSNIQLPIATYFLAESYRKMSETRTTPMKTKRIYLEKAKENLETTLALINNSKNHTDKNYSLRLFFNDNIKNIYQMLNRAEDYINDSYSSPSNAVATNTNNSNNSIRNRRSEGGGGDRLNNYFGSAVGYANNNNKNVGGLYGGGGSPSINELTTLMIKVMETLTIVQDDIVMLRAKLITVEEQLNKKHEIGSVVDPTNVLNDNLTLTQQQKQQPESILPQPAQQSDIKDKSQTVKSGDLSFSSTPITTTFATTPTSSTNNAAATNVSTTIPETKTSTATSKPKLFSNFSFGTPSFNFGGNSSDTSTTTSNKAPVMNVSESNTTSALQKSTDLTGKQTTTTTVSNLSKPIAVVSTRWTKKAVATNVSTTIPETKTTATTNPNSLLNFVFSPPLTFGGINSDTSTTTSNKAPVMNVSESNTTSALQKSTDLTGKQTTTTTVSNLSKPIAASSTSSTNNAVATNVLTTIPETKTSTATTNPNPLLHFVSSAPLTFGGNNSDTTTTTSNKAPVMNLSESNTTSALQKSTNLTGKQTTTTTVSNLSKPIAAPSTSSTNNAVATNVLTTIPETKTSTATTNSNPLLNFVSSAPLTFGGNNSDTTTTTSNKAPVMNLSESNTTSALQKSTNLTGKQTTTTTVSNLSKPIAAPSTSSTNNAVATNVLTTIPETKTSTATTNPNPLLNFVSSAPLTFGGNNSDTTTTTSNKAPVMNLSESNTTSALQKSTNLTGKQTTTTTVSNLSKPIAAPSTSSTNNAVATNVLTTIPETKTSTATTNPNSLLNFVFSPPLTFGGINSDTSTTTSNKAPVMNVSESNTTSALQKSTDLTGKQTTTTTVSNLSKPIAASSTSSTNNAVATNVLTTIPETKTSTATTNPNPLLNFVSSAPLTFGGNNSDTTTTTSNKAPVMNLSESNTTSALQKSTNLTGKQTTTTTVSNLSKPIAAPSTSSTNNAVATNVLTTIPETKTSTATTNPNPLLNFVSSAPLTFGGNNSDTTTTTSNKAPVMNLSESNTTSALQKSTNLTGKQTTTTTVSNLSKPIAAPSTSSTNNAVATNVSTTIPETKTSTATTNPNSLLNFVFSPPLTFGGNNSDTTTTTSNKAPVMNVSESNTTSALQKSTDLTGKQTTTTTVSNLSKPIAVASTSSTKNAVATNVSTTIPETKTSTATTNPNSLLNFVFSPPLTFGGNNSDTTTTTSNKAPVMNLSESNTPSALQKSTDLTAKQTTTTTVSNLSKPIAAASTSSTKNAVATNVLTIIPSTKTSTATTNPNPLLNFVSSAPLTFGGNNSDTTTTTSNKAPVMNLFSPKTTPTLQAAAAAFFNKITPTTKPNVPNTTAVTPNKPTPAVAAATAAANDNEEPEFIPTAHFEPVIPLPDLVDTQTGEENEHIKFEHRAKLLRFVRETKEWKERGIGNIKLLVNKSDPNKVRLLMRREQIFKLCCNQMLTKNMKFSPMGTSGNVLTWYGQDFSENELQVELLAIRFKTADICNDFHKAVLEAQTNMSTGDDPIVPVQKLDKPVVAKSAINNNEKKSSILPPTTTTTASTNAEGFGDKFKPATDSWQCSGCYVTNKSNEKICVACGTDAPGAVASIASTSTTPETSSIAGLGDKSKVKVGSWECKSCNISNTADSQYCSACKSQKDDTVPKKSAAAPAGIQLSSTPSEFSFGVVPFAALTSTPSAVVSSVATGSSSSSTAGASDFSVAAGICGALTSSTTSTTTALNGSATKPNLEQKETFSFVYKPKSPGSTKIKSPMKNTSVVEGVEDVTVDKDNIEEGNNPYFMPVIPLPDKVEVKTGEEEEDILYSHRTKLYRYVDSEWKERGLGDLKILKHKQTGKLRVVMRREHIFKICLNHGLTSDIEYNKKDDKSWHFVANNYSEGAVELTQFCLRFKTPEIAVAFKKAIDDSLSGELNEPIKSDEAVEDDGADEANEDNKADRPAATENNTSKSSEQTTVTKADKQKLKELKLPEDFFDERPACTGCRGCNSEEFQFPPEISNLTSNVNDQMPLPLIMPSVPASTVTSESQLPESAAGVVAVADNSILKQSILEQSLIVSPTATAGASPFSQLPPPTSNILDSGVNKSNCGDLSEGSQLTTDEQKTSFPIFEGGATSKSTPEKDINAFTPIVGKIIGSTFAETITAVETTTVATETAATATAVEPITAAETITTETTTTAETIITEAEANTEAATTTTAANKSFNNGLGVSGDDRNSSADDLNNGNIFGSTFASVVSGAAATAAETTIKVADKTAAETITTETKIVAETTTEAATTTVIKKTAVENITAATETAVTETAITETAVTETAITETAATETAATETAVTEKAATETAVTETAATETAVTETAVTEKAATETAAPETAATATAATETAATVTAATVTAANKSFNNGLGVSGGDQNSSAVDVNNGNIFGSTFASVVSGAAATKTATATTATATTAAATTAAATTAAATTAAQPTSPEKISYSFATLTSSSGGTDFVKLPETSTKPSFSTPSSAQQPHSLFGLSNKNDIGDYNAEANTSLNGSLGIGGDDKNASSDAGDDPNYDPHYDPIIAIPDEIVVSTGEEEEEKLFGERAKLFRNDANTREWIERGVGELKILHHPGKETYRLLMRREQVFKCVLNHALSDEFVISPMKASDKAFCWATNNYADESAGNLEQLSVRFENSEIAKQFELVTKCISQLKLEPEDD